MKGLFWVLALFALAVVVALGGRLNDGYALIVFPPWRIEVGLNLLILAGILAFVLFYVVLRTLSLTFKLPARAGEYRARRRQEQAADLFQDAVRLLFEGRFGQALRKAAQAHASGSAPAASALVAARAAQRLREEGRLREWLEHAREADGGNEAAALMLEAEMYVDGRHFAEGLAVLTRFHARHGRHIAALRLELRALQGVGDWEGVLRTARQLEKRGALAAEVARPLKLHAHLENVAAHRADAAHLSACLRRIPDSERDGRIAYAAAVELLALGEDQAAQRVAEESLERGGEFWNDDLVALYGRLSGPDVTGRIAHAERWLRERPADAGLLLALGRLCRSQRLWGKAQSYLEASLALDARREIHLELAHLLDELEKTDAANEHYRLSVGASAAS